MKVGPINDQSWFTIGEQQKPTGESFSNFLNDALQQLETTQNDAQAAGQQMAMGDSAQVHQVMIAYEKAYMALNLTVEIRNRLVEAYQEIMRIQM